ncbi:MAG: hypothetical protein OXH06_18875 [Gemmatimonadetes bacterium]|nr:hypothetical protein [Gemmatimonadota bacterium]
MTREEIYDAVQSLAVDKDLYAASEFVLGLWEETEMAKVFEDLMLDCYWKAKSVAQVIHFANVGIHYCLAQACERDEDDDSARELRFAAKRMATNAASFTWIGWEEPGVEISPGQMRHGIAFARYAVRQLHDLDPTDAQLAFTYWYLGAHLMAEGSYPEALSAFKQTKEFNESAGDNPDYQTMIEGYIGLAKILSGDDEAGESEFDASIAALEARDSEDAAFFTKQLVNVRVFFEKRKAADEEAGRR